MKENQHKQEKILPYSKRSSWPVARLQSFMAVRCACKRVSAHNEAEPLCLYKASGEGACGRTVI